MPITIKELLASDTISQAADKINFNFDQLLLNGGGPQGPIGVQGPPGPIGGRGKRGSQWYEDPSVSPGTNPNSLIFLDLLEGDSYLQSDGTVWEYNGTAWIATVINLTGPQGPTGVSAGFGYFGKTAPVVGENTIYPLVMPSGNLGGANTSNEGVPALLVGGVVSNTSPAVLSTGGFISFTSAYQLTNDMAESIGSEVTSLFIHQKNSSSKSIIFHGGGFLGTDNFEQDNINDLSYIQLNEDDKLRIGVPKAPTSPTGLGDLVGYIVQTNFKGQQYYSGKAVDFFTGQDSTVRLPGESSDFSITVNESNPSNLPKFSVSVSNPNSILRLGNVSLPGTPNISRQGSFLLSVQDSEILTNSTSKIISTGLITVQSNTGNVNITASSGIVSSTALNIENNSTFGILNDVSSTGNITNTIFNGAYSIRASAGTGNLAGNPTNSAGYIELYARNRITLNTNNGGIFITNVSPSAGNIVLNATGRITQDAVGYISLNSSSNYISATAATYLNLTANGPASGVGGKIELNTSFDDINITSGNNINIKTGITGILDTFNLNAGGINMTSAGNTTLTSNANFIVNVSDDINVTAGDDITVTASDDINVTAANVININSTTFGTNITSGDDIQLQAYDDIRLYANGNISAIVDIITTLTRPTITGTSFPNIGVKINSEISPENHTLGVVGVEVTRQNPAITSGSFSYAGGSVDSCVMNWIKIGAIVHVTGNVVFNQIYDPSINFGSIPLPVVLSTSDGTDINGFSGHGTALVWEGSIYDDAKMVAVKVQQGVGGPTNINKNYFVITHSPTNANPGVNDETDIVVASGGSAGNRQPKATGFVRGRPTLASPVQINNEGVINASAIVDFSFSYRLDN